MIMQLFVINKSGGMIYAFERSKTIHINGLMVLTSTLHSVSTMFDSINNETLRLDSTQVFYFKKHIITYYRTATGTSFVFVGREPAHKWIKDVYRMYVDYVSKDPFYIAEMPIKSGNFKPELLLEEIL